MRKQVPFDMGICVEEEVLNLLIQLGGYVNFGQLKVIEFIDEVSSVTFQIILQILD